MCKVGAQELDQGAVAVVVVDHVEGGWSLSVRYYIYRAGRCKHREAEVVFPSVKSAWTNGAFCTKSAGSLNEAAPSLYSSAESVRATDIKAYSSPLNERSA